MGSKVIVFLGLLAAMLLLLSAEVAARDLAETANAVETSKEIEAEPTQYGGGYYPPRGRPYYPPRRVYCRHGCCGRGYYGRPCRCCSYAGQAVDADFNEAETHN